MIQRFLHFTVTHLNMIPMTNICQTKLGDFQYILWSVDPCCACIDGLSALFYKNIVDIIL